MQTHEARRYPQTRPLTLAEMEIASGGFWWFLPIVTGIAMGLGYCIADGTLDPPRGSVGDFPTGPKNAG